MLHWARDISLWHTKDQTEWNIKTLKYLWCRSLGYADCRLLNSVYTVGIKNVVAYSGMTVYTE